MVKVFNVLKVNVFDLIISIKIGPSIEATKAIEKV
jgi:hypothetical protein